MRALRLLGLGVGLTVAGCVGGSGASGTNQGALKVTLVQHYYWPAAEEGSIGGQPAEIEVFPLVTALVVQRRDGQPLGTADENASRQAAHAYCARQGRQPSASTASRLSEGAWAFPACEGL